MITKETIQGITCIRDSELKNVYSEEMYNQFQMYENDIKKIVDQACTEGNSLVEEVRSFYKIATPKIGKEKAIEIAMNIWKLSKCDFIDCLTD